MVVETYFLFQPSEAQAPFVEDARQYLDRVQRAGKLFWEALLAQSETPLTGSGDMQHIAEQHAIRAVAIRWVQSHLGRYLEQFDFRHHTDWNSLLDIMGTCQAAFVATKDFIDEKEPRGFVEGHQWAELVWKLLELAKKHGLPAQIAKFDDPARASPFVNFMFELQKTFPAEFQRHQTSKAALAEAMTVFRRTTARAIRAIAAQKEKSANGPT